MHAYLHTYNPASVRGTKCAQLNWHTITVRAPTPASGDRRRSAPGRVHVDRAFLPRNFSPAVSFCLDETQRVNRGPRGRVAGAFSGSCIETEWNGKGCIAARWIHIHLRRDPFAVATSMAPPSIYSYLSQLKLKSRAHRCTEVCTPRLPPPPYGKKNGSKVGCGQGGLQH